MFNHSWTKMNTQFGKHEIRVVLEDPDHDKIESEMFIDMFFDESATDQEMEELISEYLTNLYNSLPDLAVDNG